MFKKQGAPDDGLQKGGARYLAPPYLLSLYGSTGQTGPAKGETPGKSGLSKGQNAKKSGLFAAGEGWYNEGKAGKGSDGMRGGILAQKIA